MMMVLLLLLLIPIRGDSPVLRLDYLVVVVFVVRTVKTILMRHLELERLQLLEGEPELE